jgi:hypothetical protein
MCFDSKRPSAVTGPIGTNDYNGNTLTGTTGSNTTGYTWDFENRLISVTLLHVDLKGYAVGYGLGSRAAAGRYCGDERICGAA